MAIKLVLVVLLIFVASVIIFSMYFFLRPLAVIVWFRRLALRREGLKKTIVQTSAGKQAVWCGGNGPFLIMLHGAGDQAGTWNKVAPDLKRHFELFIPDLAGHGESEPHTAALSIGTVLAALEQVCDALLPANARIAIVGNSFGAWLAMLYAQKHPQQVSRVVAMGGGPIKEAIEINLMPKDRAGAARLMENVLDPSSPRPPGFVLDDVVRVSRSGAISRLAAAGVADMSKYLMQDKLESFPLPVDLLWGSSDRLVLLEHAKGLQAQLPQSTLTVIERCGHAPQLERPGEVTRVLLKLLAPDSAGTPASTTPVSIHSGANS
jgi:pimeloyl-ACP methyl ester carboxylesterase